MKEVRYLWQQQRRSM